MPSLTSLHTFQLPSTCDDVRTFSSTEELLTKLDLTRPYYLLGEGSNSIFLDDFDGVVLLNQILGIEYHESTDMHHIRVGAGESWHAFVQHCMENGWWGLENLALIPGTVGAAPIQNIGAYGVEVGQYISAVYGVDLVTGKTLRWLNEACEFGYRDSVFKRQYAGRVCITHVDFQLPKTVPVNASYGELDSLIAPSHLDVFHKVIAIRQSKLPDPKLLGNAGSFFKNPVIDKNQYHTLLTQYPQMPSFALPLNLVKVPAAWFIDQAGFKGKEEDGVRCHPTQPLVLTNTGSATGDSVLKMAQAIINKVHDQFGVELEPEVRLIGKTGLMTL